jgi:hypothetical protein
MFHFFVYIKPYKVVLFGIKLFNGNYNFPLNNNKMNATANKTSTPKIIVKNDYDGVFENRVKSAIKLNQKNNTPMINKINIDSGPYRSYCMSYDKVSDNTVNLDFYSASRVFGFGHTIEDIAKAIAV